MAISVNDLYSSLGGASINPNTIASVADTDKLTDNIKNAQNKDEAMEACEQFEAYLVQQMFKSMEEASKVFNDDEDDSSGSDYVDMFSDNMYQSISENMIANGGGLGIANMLYESMERNGQINVASEDVGTNPDVINTIATAAMNNKNE